MKKSLKTLSKAFLLVLCISLIFVFGANGCKFETPSGKENSGSEEAREISEQPDKELFDQYFCCINLNLSSHTDTILPHQGGTLEATFRSNKNFKFEIAVLNLGTNDFVERCSTTVSSYGSEGLVMEALEWAFLRPGNYEYRIYIENKLAAALPFEVVSYFDYFFRKRGKEAVVTSNEAKVKDNDGLTGPKIAFTSDRDSNNEIYVMDFDESNQTRLTNNDSDDSLPRWSPIK